VEVKLKLNKDNQTVKKSLPNDEVMPQTKTQSVMFSNHGWQTCFGEIDTFRGWLYTNKIQITEGIMIKKEKKNLIY
jgi:hypothetical protein